MFEPTPSNWNPDRLSQQNVPPKSGMTLTITRRHGLRFEKRGDATKADPGGGALGRRSGNLAAAARTARFYSTGGDARWAEAASAAQPGAGRSSCTPVGRPRALQSVRRPLVPRSDRPTGSRPVTSATLAELPCGTLGDGRPQY
jgi:hypothetical protein